MRDGVYEISICSIDDEVFGPHVPETKELEGLTFYTPDAGNTKVLVNGKVVHIQKNVEAKKAESVTITSKTYQ